MTPPMAINEQFELVEALEPTIKRLLTEHRERRKHWYFHDMVPWERGRSFRDEPWDPSQCTISEQASTSLVLNLLTEDNLPYYHAAIEKSVPEDSALAEWNHLWTAEEGQHAIAIRSYLLTSRNCDPNELEDDRLRVMTVGYEPNWQNPAELFAYTAAQELATRVSHRNAGKLTDDPVAFELMRAIASDENHHFVFYKGVMAAMLREAPGVALEGIYRTFANFQMPGTGIPGFLRRSIEIAKAGVYNLRIHHDRVIQPLLRDWAIADLMDLSPKAAEVQERLMHLPELIVEKAERFERRFAPVTA
ncbi:MAG: acyl-ACP desaturase [Acidimicrobiia bacterium]